VANKQYIISAYDDGTFGIPLVTRASVDDNGILTIVEPDTSQIKAYYKKISYCVICNKGIALFTDGPTIDISDQLKEGENLINIRLVLDLENKGSQQSVQFIVDEALEIVISMKIVGNFKIYMYEELLGKVVPSLPFSFLEEFLFSMGNKADGNLADSEPIYVTDELPFHPVIDGSAVSPNTVLAGPKPFKAFDSYNMDLVVILARKPIFMTITSVLNILNMGKSTVASVTTDALEFQITSLIETLTLKNSSMKIETEKLSLASQINDILSILMIDTKRFNVNLLQVIEILIKNKIDIQMKISAECLEISTREFMKDLDDLLLEELDPLILYEV
jgi:hypothetical protein